MLALGDPEHDLTDDGGLAGPGITYRQDVLVFGGSRNPQRSLLAFHNKSNSIPFELAGEGSRRDLHRPFDPTAVPQLNPPPQVFANGERQRKKKSQSSPKQGFAE